MADAAAIVPSAAPPGDDQIKQDFMATRALAARPDPAAALDARFAQPAPPTTAAPMVPPVDPNQPIGARVVQAAGVIAPPAPASFAARLRQAASGGLMQSLHDLGASATAVAGGKPTPEATPADYEKPLTWDDLTHPGEALTKAVYQIAHGAPVLAAGVGGALAGGAIGAEAGTEAGAAGGAVAAGPAGAAAGAAGGAVVGGGGGALAGGALGAGAMSAAQELGPFYASALKANPNDPAKAFDQALARAGSAGVFSAAGWALFGLKPFAGAVRNLMMQAFAVQPATAVAGKVADNAVTGQPLAEGAADVIPGAIVGTAAPALAHAGVAALAGAARCGGGRGRSSGFYARFRGCARE